MQLGARWQTGATPHRGVPPELHDVIHEQEAAYPAASAWTLTWLEGRPRCALDDFVIVSIDAYGKTIVETVGANSAAFTAEQSGEASLGKSDDEEEDDDDWLS